MQKSAKKTEKAAETSIITKFTSTFSIIIKSLNLPSSSDNDTKKAKVTLEENIRFDSSNENNAMSFSNNSENGVITDNIDIDDEEYKNEKNKNNDDEDNNDKIMSIKKTN